MKSFFKTVLAVFEEMGNVRAASALARMGQHDAARRIMLK